jgi:hypothetical protein
VNNIVPFNRYHALGEFDARRQIMESLMLDMAPAEWFRTIDSIIESWSSEDE